MVVLVRLVVSWFAGGCRWHCAVVGARVRVVDSDQGNVMTDVLISEEGTQAKG